MFNSYYTYAYLREDGTPYYVGKGSGGRTYRRTKKCIKPPKDKSRVIFLKQNLTEEEAFKHEIYMIAVFGRKDLGTGILYNRTDGGDGASGAIRSPETRAKLSAAFKGKTLSPETRAKFSAAKKGRTFSPEHRAKLSAALKEKVWITDGIQSRRILSSDVIPEGFRKGLTKGVNKNPYT